MSHHENPDECHVTPPTPPNGEVHNNGHHHHGTTTTTTRETKFGTTLQPHVIAILQQNGLDDGNESSLTSKPQNTFQRAHLEAINKEKNERSLVRIFTQLKDKASRKEQEIKRKKSIIGGQSSEWGVLNDVDTSSIHSNEELEMERRMRTMSLVSVGKGEIKIMTKTYKYVTSIVLWFCYFSLALDDYIFGPTFDDLSKILNTTFENIAIFTVIRQFSYTLGSVGKFPYKTSGRKGAFSKFLNNILLLLSPKIFRWHRLQLHQSSARPGHSVDHLGTDTVLHALRPIVVHLLPVGRTEWFRQRCL